MKTLSVFFIGILGLVIVFLIYRAMYPETLFPEDEEHHTSTNPFAPNVIVVFSAARAREITDVAKQIIESARNKSRIVVAVAHIVYDGIRDTSVLSEIQAQKIENILPHMRVTVVKSTLHKGSSIIKGYKRCLEELAVDERYCVLTHAKSKFPQNWDLDAIKYFEKNKNPMQLCLTTPEVGHFSTCNGSIRGVPHFTMRKYTINIDSQALFPTISASPFFTLCHTAQAKAALATLPLEVETPEWTAESILSSALYDRGLNFVNPIAFGTTKYQKIDYEKEKWSPESLEKILSNAWISQQLDITQKDVVPGKARLGLSSHADDAERRAKWGDSTEQDIAEYIACGGVEALD